MADFPLSNPVTLTFFVIPVVLALLFVAGVAHAYRGTRLGSARVARLAFLGVLAWMLLTWRVAESGVLREWDATPPPFALLLAAIVVIALAVAFRGVGKRLATAVPLWALVAVQAFRLPLEIAMHVLAAHGVMPPQMTYTGLNFDIVTGATAIVVAGAVASGLAGSRLVLAWNVLGLALLANVMTVALLSTPRLRMFGDAVNVFVTYTPFVWLPAVMVLAALLGHLLIFRALRLQPTI